jgi:hypothetical protein
MKKILVLALLSLGLMTLGGATAFAQIVAQPTNYPTKILGVVGGNNGTDSTIYDVNPANGNATNPRVPVFAQSSAKPPFVGFTYDGSHVLIGLTASYLSNYQSTFFTIAPNPSFSSLGLIGQTRQGNTLWQCGYEGDITYDRIGHKLYGICNTNGSKLVTFDSSTGKVLTMVLVSGTGRYTALAFDPAGTLYALDTLSRKLVKVNKSTGAITQTLSLTGTLPNTSDSGGMGFNDAGVLYAAFGGQLVTINSTNGAVTVRGGTPLFSGLIVEGGGSIRNRLGE